MAEDGLIVMIEGANAVWHREEALASVIDTMFVDLPVATPELQAQMGRDTPTLQDRLASEFLTFKASVAATRV